MRFEDLRKQAEQNEGWGWATAERIPSEGSSCGAKGKVQAYGQVKLLPAPQLLPESICQCALEEAG